MKRLPAHLGAGQALPPDAPPDAAFQIGDQGGSVRPHHCQTTPQRLGNLSLGRQNPGLWPKRALPEGSGGAGRGLTSRLCASWTSNPRGAGGATAARAETPGPALRAAWGWGLEGQRRWAGGAATGPHSTRLPGPPSESQGQRARPSSAQSQAPPACPPGSGFLPSPLHAEAARLKHEKEFFRCTAGRALKQGRLAAGSGLRTALLVRAGPALAHPAPSDTGSQRIAFSFRIWNLLSVGKE